jgi:hypothetical protein
MDGTPGILPMWLGLSAEVARVVGACNECDRVRTAFNAKHPMLQLLPIKGLFHRWGLDFARPLPESSGRNRYVLVMVEQFRKTVILLPTRDKEPGTAAAIFTREAAHPLWSVRGGSNRQGGNVWGSVSSLPGCGSD